MIGARSQHVQFFLGGGGVELLFERQLTIQTENVNTNTKKNRHNVKEKYVRKVSENNISQKNI